MSVIGVVAGLLSIVQFGINNFKTDPLPGSTFKVAVALDGGHGGTDNAGGDLPDVRVWNDYGDYVGITTDPGTVSDGNIGEVHVEHENQGIYTLFSANTDAICIAWVTNTWDDERGGNQYAVVGDFGQTCGATWYAGGLYPSADSDYQPNCFWIDANGDQPSTGFQVRWPAYSGTNFSEGVTDPTTFCNNIDFGTRTERDPNSINYYVKKRSTVMKRVAWVAQELVISDTASHSAKALCESETSMGPDFVHTGEKLFCDMGSKILYDFCSASSTTTCYDADKQVLITPGAGTRRAAAAPAYERVRDWRANVTA